MQSPFTNGCGKSSGPFHIQNSNEDSTPQTTLSPQVPHRGRPQRPLATSLDCAAALRGRLPAPSHLPQFGKAEKCGRSRPRPPQGPVQSQSAAHAPRPPRASQAGISRRHSRACAVGVGRVRSTKWRRRGPRRGRSEPNELRPQSRTSRAFKRRACRPKGSPERPWARPTPGVPGRRRRTEGWQGEASRFPPTNALPPAPSPPPCGPLKHHQEEVVPQRPPQSTALSRRRPPHRAKPRPLATRAAMKKPRSEKPCPPREPLTYRTGSLAAGTRSGP